MAFETPVDGFIPATGGSNPNFYNAALNAPIDATVPQMIEATSGIVTDALALNQGFAQDALAAAKSTMAALSTASFPPELPSPPQAPSIITTFGSALTPGFEATPDFGSIDASQVETFALAPISIPTIDADIPDYVPIITGLQLPDAPAYVAPDSPVEPGIDLTMDLPTAPVANYGAVPDLDEIVMPSYTQPALPLFNDDAPTFNVLPPSPFIDWREPVYASEVRDAVAGVIQEMLAGGTGIAEDDERGIWERGRAREEVAAWAAIDAAINQWAARGFAHPTGALNAQTLAIREESERKINEQSREVSLEQAKLAQQNRQFAVERAISYEQVFVGVFLAVVERNFQIAKFGVETQIQIYNMAVTAFNVERQVYTAKIEKYRAQLEAVFAYLKAFEALVNAEKAKAEVNVARVQMYEAKVKAFSAQVDAYRALVEGANVRASLQKNKVEIYKAQVDAMVGRINGERAKFEAYDSRVKGETAKIGLEEANSRTYAARVQAIGTKADIIVKRVDAQIQSNKQIIDFNVANMQRVATLNGQQLAVIQSRLAAFQGITTRATARYEADRQTQLATLQAQVSLSQVAIAKYQALLEQWKTRSQEVIQFAEINAASLRAAGQMASNLASGAMAGTHVSAGISASSSAGKTQSRGSTDSTSQARNVNENSNYSIVHNYQHRA